MTFSKKQISRIITAALMFLFMANFSFGQGINATELLNRIILNPEYAKEAVIIKEMRLKKVNDQKILTYMDDTYGKPRRAAALKRQASGEPLPHNFTHKDLYLTSSCSSNDIGVELGTFATWQGQTSTWTTGGCSLIPWTAATLPVAGRITIVPTPSSDPCATNPGFPIALPSPQGGSYSIKLGNNQINAESERITHQFIVQPSDTNFIYQYAVVFEDPGHLPSNQPFFDFVIKAQNGDTIPCSFQHYTAGGSIPGFQHSTNPSGCGGDPTYNAVYYKPWTTVGVNLGNYLGQQVTIVCTTGDCSQCGHFGYTYLDFSCGTSTSSQFCAGTNSVTCVAPTEPGATYSWTPTGATTQSVTVNPQVVDTINVYVNPPSGCGYYVNYILNPTVITPAFTYTLGCTTANFTDATTITGGTVSSYSWSFPGGSPASSTSQIPPTITYATPGTYIVTLNVVSQAGCTAASVPVSITIQPPPTVTAGPDVSICGNNTAVLSGSGLPAGGTYSWSPTTNLSSTTIANPTVGPLSVPATYTLTYTNSNGCKNTDVVTVGIGAEPVALASYSLALTCEGVGAQFKDSSLNATAWTWDFGDGTTSTLQNPPAHGFTGSGVHFVTLTASNGSCDSSIVIPVIVTDIVQYMEIGNVFTPNNDAENDCFTPIFKVPNATQLQQCITMEIFDRWGIKIFESEAGTNVCWDGKTKSNTKAKDGTYYYIITLGENTFKGYVTLIR